MTAQSIYGIQYCGSFPSTKLIKMDSEIQIVEVDLIMNLDFEKVAISANYNKDFLIVWAEHCFDNISQTYLDRNWTIYAKYIKEYSMELGNSFEVSLHLTQVGYSLFPSVGVAEDNHVLIIWIGSGMDYGRDIEDIYGRCYDSFGIPINVSFSINSSKSIFRINSIRSLYNRFPAMATNRRGYSVVVWAAINMESLINSNIIDQTSAIYGQMIGPNCSKVGEEFFVAYIPNKNYPYLSVDIKESGDFIVVWRHNTQTSTIQRRDRSWGQKFHSSTKKIGEIFEIFPYGPNPIKGPCVKYLNENNYLISVTNYGNDTYYHGIFAQIFDDDQNTLTDIFQVNSYYLHDQAYSDIGSFTDGSFIIVWASDGADGDQDAIQGQYFGSDGNKIGIEFAINTQDSGDQIFPKIAVNSDDEAMVTWISGNSPHNGIFVQKYNIIFSDVVDSKDSNNPILGVELLKEFTNKNSINFVLSDDEKFIWNIDTDGCLDLYDRYRNDDYINLNKSFTNLTNGQIFYMIKYQQYLYIANDSFIFVIDVLDPLNPINVNAIAIQNSVIVMYIFDNILYIAYEVFGILAYDLSTPSKPNLIKIVVKGEVFDFQVYCQQLYYLEGYTENFVIINITDLQSEMINNFTIKLHSPTAYAMDITKDGLYVVVGTNDGIKIIDLKKKIVIYTVETNFIYSLSFSNDNSLLSVCSEKYHLLYDTRNILNLVLIENTTFTSFLIYSMILKNNSHIFIISEGIHFLKILTPIYEDLVPSLVPMGKNFIKNGYSLDIMENETNIIAFISNSSRINIMDMSDMNSTSFPIIKTINIMENIIKLIYSSNKLYTLTKSGLYISEFTDNNLNFIHNTGLLMEPIQFLLSNDLNHIYVINKLQLMILDANTLDLIKYINFNFLYNGIPLRMVIYLDNMIVIACKEDGIIIIELNNLYLGEEILDVSLIERDSQLIILAIGGRNLKIFEFNRLNFSFSYISQIYIEQNSIALKLINDNFVIVETEIIVCLIQISNLESPILLDYIKLNYDNHGSDIAVCKKNQYLIFPTMEVIGLYQGGTKLYSFIKMKIFNNQKQFDISLYGLSFITGNSISKLFKILKIDVQRIQPVWVTTNIETKLISIFPLNIDDLKVFTQLIIEVTVARKIDSSLIPNNELSLLNSLGALDMEMYPTINFDPNSEKFTNNQKNVISHHLFQQKLVFPLTSFLNLNKPPRILESIQAQFHLQNNNRTWILIERRLDFQISLDSYLDPDGDFIMFSVETLSESSNWLIFDSETRRLYGTPSKTNVGNQVILKIIVSDGYASVDDILNFTIIKNSTIVQKNGDAFANSGNVFNVQGSFVYISPYSFIDVNGDQLIISAEYYYKKKNEPLPYWIVFDSSRLNFRGTVDPKYIAYKRESKTYYQDFKIILSAKNIADEVVSRNFSIIFKNNPPKLNVKKPLAYQFSKVCNQNLNSENLLVEIDFQIDFDKDTFLDDNINSNLKYTASLNDSNLLPEWVQFDAINLKLLFKPTENQLNQYFAISITANNGVQSISDSFKFKVAASWIFILKLLAKIVGPLIAILGLFKKRSTIYYYFCKKHYKFKRIDIRINEPFIRDFYLIEEYLRIGYCLFQEILKNQIFLEEKSLSLLFLDSNKEKIKEFVNLLKQASRKYINIKNNSFFFDIDKELCEKDNTLYIIVEAFLLDILIEKQQHLQNLYNLLKKSLFPIYSNNWYFPLINIKDEKRYLKHQLFPKIILNTKLIKSKITEIEKINSIKKCCCCCKNKKNIKKINDIEFNIIFAMIKKDVIGIPSKPKQWYHIFERAKGESILIPINRIHEIRCKRVENVDKGFIDKIRTFFGLHYMNLETSINKKLPCWLDFEITLGILRFSGHPTELDEGILLIDIIDDNGIIIKEFELNVIQKQKTMIWEKKSLKTSLNLRDIIVKKQESSLFEAGSKNYAKKSSTTHRIDDEMIDKLSDSSLPQIEMSQIKHNGLQALDVGPFIKKYADESERSELYPLHN